MRQRLVAVFDIGCTLRAPCLPGVPELIKKRNYPTLRVLFNTLAASSFWLVVVLTAGPHSEHAVCDDLSSMGLAMPDELIVVRKQSDKAEQLARLKPDLVIDDDSAPLAAGRALGAYCLRPF